MDLIPVDFLLMLLGFLVAACLVAAIAYGRRQRRVRLTVDPHRDYLRSGHRSECRRRRRYRGSSAGAR